MFFDKTATGASLITRTFLSSSSRSRQDSELASFCEVEKYLLTLYATVGIFIEAERDITNFNQHVGKSTVEYAQALWTKALRFGAVYDDSRLKRSIS